MKRAFGSLHQGPFHLLVIGGGVYGAWVAYDAALRGITVAMVEKDDWSQGTSSATTKLIHGGLRYLEQGNVGLVRQALAERRRLAALAPHRVRPLPFVVPVYRGGRLGPGRLHAGLWLYDRLAGCGQPVSRHGHIEPGTLLSRAPFLNPNGLRRSFTYGDCQTDDARFVLELVAGACRAGACAVNHAQAVALLRRRDRVVGAVVRDGPTGEELEVRAEATVCAAGPWVDTVLGREGVGPLTRLSKGVHLVLPALPADGAFLLLCRKERRVFFTIPWYGRSLVGTTDDDYSGDPDQVSVGRKDVNSILEAVNRFFPGCGWGEGSVLGSFVGLRALKQEWGKAASAVSREWVLEEPLERFLVSVGGKYTTARAEAERIVDRVEVMLNRRASRTKPTRSRPLPWCPQEPFDAWLGRVRQEATQLGLAPDMAESLALRYGASVPGVFERIRQCRSLGRRLVPGLPFCRAEVAHAAAAEMAVSLADVLRRRLPVMILSPLQPEVLRDAAELTAQTLGWEEGRKARELRAAEDAWSPGWS